MKDRATDSLLALVHQNPNLTRLEVAAQVPKTIFVKLVIIQLSRLQPRRDASTYKCIQASSQDLSSSIKSIHLELDNNGQRGVSAGRIVQPHHALQNLSFMGFPSDWEEYLLLLPFLNSCSPTLKEFIGSAAYFLNQDSREGLAQFAIHPQSLNRSDLPPTTATSDNDLAAYIAPSGT